MGEARDHRAEFGPAGQGEQPGIRALPGRTVRLRIINAASGTNFFIRTGALRAEEREDPDAIYAEVVHLRITANKSTEWDKDGTIHTFTINALKDQGWDLRLKEGTQDFTLVAPAEPGSYVVECTVKCGQMA